MAVLLLNVSTTNTTSPQYSVWCCVTSARARRSRLSKWQSRSWIGFSRRRRMVVALSLFLSLFAVDRLKVSASGNGSECCQIDMRSLRSRLAHFAATTAAALVPLLLSASTSAALLASVCWYAATEAKATEATAALVISWPSRACVMVRWFRCGPSAKKKAAKTHANPMWSRRDHWRIKLTALVTPKFYLPVDLSLLL